MVAASACRTPIGGPAANVIKSIRHVTILFTHPPLSCLNHARSRYGTIVSCDASYEYGRNSADLPNLSVAVTVYLSIPVGASAGTTQNPVQRLYGALKYPGGVGASPRNRIGTSIFLPPTVKCAVSIAVFSGSPVPPSVAVIRKPSR